MKTPCVQGSCLIFIPPCRSHAKGDGEHEVSIDPSSMSRWRGRAGKAGVEELLQQMKWMKRRAAMEPGIGHLKAEHHLGRNRLWDEQGDRINAILGAAGMNLRKLLRRAAAFCRAWLAAIEVFGILMGFRGPPQMKGQFA